jgi:Rod binding domain-containing protein
MAEQTLRGLFAAGSGAGLAVLATTTSGEAACAFAEQPNVLLVHRMTDQAAARRLAAVLPGGGEAAEDLQALADGEFMLAVSQPGRLVKRALASGRR